MEPILSKGEIEELIAALHSGQIDAELEKEDLPSYADQGLVPLDLTDIRHSFKWRIVNFDIILDSFARNCSVFLSSKLKMSMSVKRESVESFEFREFMQKLQGVGGIGIFEAYPLKGSGLLFFDNHMCFFLLELLLGASEDNELVVPDRQLSVIEKNILKGLMQKVCHNFQDAFIPVEALQCELMRLEIDPRVVNIMSDDTEVMVSEYSVHLAGGKGKMSLVLPYFALEPYKDILKDVFMSPNWHSKAETWAMGMQRNIFQMDTELAVEFGKVSLPVRDILNLNEGDILLLDSENKSPLQIFVGDKPKFNGLVGLKNGKKAVRIVRRIDSQENT